MFGRKYHHLNRIGVSAEAILANYQYLTSLAGLPVAPVLKSNAYGHGIELVAKVLDGQRAPFFCVDSLFEAYQLLKIRVKTPILVMGYAAPESFAVKRLPFSFAVYTLDMLRVIKKYQPQAGVHVFVDTGMHREGIDISGLSNFVRLVRREQIKIEGLMSHLAQADKPGNPETRKQVETFKEAVKILKDESVNPQWIHLPASLGILNTKSIHKVGNMARAGVALYGLDPTFKDRNLRPALEFKTTVEQVKVVKKGEKIGYGFAYTADKKMTIAVLPAGYNDGVEKKLSNQGFVTIKDRPCRIVGRVSMNIMTVDVTGLAVRLGDEAVVYSRNRADGNCLENVAKTTGISVYELLVHLNPTTKRVLK